MRGGIGSNACSQGEAKDEVGDSGRESGVGGEGVLTQIAKGERTGAVAVATVVEDKAGDVVGVEEQLGLLPVVEAVSDAVADEDSGHGR